MPNININIKMSQLGEQFKVSVRDLGGVELEGRPHSEKLVWVPNRANSQEKIEILIFWPMYSMKCRFLGFSIFEAEALPIK